MRDCYIPDMTERFPEGLDGVDMFAPRDWEAAAWAEMERDCREAERQEIEQITRAGFEVIKQTPDGWTLAKSGDYLYLFIIDPQTGELIRIDDRAKDRPENRDSMLETWEELAD